MLGNYEIEVNLKSKTDFLDNFPNHLTITMQGFSNGQWLECTIGGHSTNETFWQDFALLIEQLVEIDNHTDVEEPIDFYSCIR